MILILIGPPSCGKGTQSELLVKNLGAKHIAAGDLLRLEIKNETALGLKIKDTIDGGDLVSDEDAFNVVKPWLDPTSQNLTILDGYPRTVGQANLLDEFLGVNAESELKVLIFDVTVENLYSRFENRYSCASCGKIYNEATNPPKQQGVCDDCGSTEFTKRADDTKEAFEKRINNYRNKTKPLIDFYRQRGLLYSIDASKNTQEVYQQIFGNLQKKGLENDTY